jgi:uncharacterized protein
LALAQGALDGPALLAAGGTLDRGETSPSRKVWLALELALIFIGAPIAMREAVHGAHIPLFLALLPVFALAVALLLADPTFRLRAELRRGFSGWQLLSILAVFGVAGGAVTYWVWLIHPQWYLEFPKNRPELWARIMLLYPLASVAVQELVYRTFYFHRYGPLFGRQRWLGILLNGVLFGFGHIVIGTTFAILGTFATGTLFALRYSATRSFWAVFLEHTLWGWLVFTVGLGRFFFTGVSNL